MTGPAQGAGSHPFDSHQTADVRAVLEPLDRFAEEMGVAVFAISHPPKNVQGKAINAITGSLGFVAAARMVFIAVEEPGTERRLLLPVKNNLAPPAGMGYRLEQTITFNDIAVSRVVWDGQPVLTTANEAIMASNSSSTDKVKEAENFLREELESGPVNTVKLFEAAERLGIAERTLRRASITLNVVKAKKGFREGWCWSLPNTALLGFQWGSKTARN